MGTFIVLVVVMAIATLICAECSIFWLPLLIFAVFTLGWDHFNGDPAVWDTIRTNWRLIGAGLLAYLPIGAAFSLPRWFFYCRTKCKDYLKDCRWEKGTAEHREYLKQNRLRPYNYKALLTSWIFYWPLCLVWWLFESMLRDVIVEFANFLYNRLSESYDRLSKKAFGITDDESK